MSPATGRLAVPVGPNDHSRGPETAAITLVEYGDYECPYCGEAFVIVRQLQREFGVALRYDGSWELEPFQRYLASLLRAA